MAHVHLIPAGEPMRTRLHVFAFRFVFGVLFGLALGSLARAEEQAFSIQIETPAAKAGA